MKFFAYIVAALTLVSTGRAVEQNKKNTKSIIVTYPSNTPPDYLAGEKAKITQAGGVITHDYSMLFKGFAADVSDEMFKTMMTTKSGQYPAEVEEDQQVSAYIGNFEPGKSAK